MSFFVLFLMMQVVFVIVEFKISNFFAVTQFIEDNQKSPVFSVSGKFFAWELFLVAIYLCLSNKP